MEDVTNTISDTAANTASVAKGITDDVIQFKFYKNPVFISFSIYILIIFGFYFNMSNNVKNSYIFSDKFRSETNDISWKHILYYPYDPSSSTSSLIKVILTPPIMWYLVIFTLFFTSIVDPSQASRQAYFYAIMSSYLVLLILFALHVGIFNGIVPPTTVDVELKLNDNDIKTYESFYRTQWVLLTFLSPIYVFSLMYVFRKLGGK